MVKRKSNKVPDCPINLTALRTLAKIPESGVFFRTDRIVKVKVNYRHLPIKSLAFRKHLYINLKRQLLRYDSSEKALVLKHIVRSINLPIVAGNRRKVDIKCIADICYFVPARGHLVSGIVVQTFEEYLECVIFNVFTAHVLRPEHLTMLDWLERYGTDTDILFRVTNVDYRHRIPFVTGEIIEEES